MRPAPIPGAKRRDRARGAGRARRRSPPGRVAGARRPALVAVAALAGLTTVLSACAPSEPSDRQAGASRQYSSPASFVTASRYTSADALVTGLISAPGGPFMRDRHGRAVFFHGVNAVYKRPPYELTVEPGKEWSFTRYDAERIAALGFDMVRLGILWEGLEPGTSGPNQPSICRPGIPRDPHMYNAAIAEAYLARVAKVVDLLGRFHVYSLLDMHQDVYSQAFRGEGAPAWAVCTGSIPIRPLGGRWSHNYANPGLDVAVDHFWTNDVVGDLQGEFDHVWSVTAAYFNDNPWILGYDPYNEPFSRTATQERRIPGETETFATDLECFYTGTARRGTLITGGAPTTCPDNDPSHGVVPVIEKADPHHLVFPEPDIYSVHNRSLNLVGPMPFPRLVLNFHVYCGHRSPVTGNPINLQACFSQQVQSITRRLHERATLSTRQQPGGPAWFMSEFGATRSVPLLDNLTTYAALIRVGWAYWSWKYYDDPTGSSDEALVDGADRLEPTAGALSQDYPQAVAGSPLGVSLNPTLGVFTFTYRPNDKIHAPTSVFVAALHYPTGYCAVVNGGTIVSHPGASHLLVKNGSGARVKVTVSGGKCDQPARA